MNPRVTRAWILGTLTVSLAWAAPVWAQTPAPGASPAVEARVVDLLSRLTLEEKLELLSGTGMDTKPVARLGIPALKMTDGPLGVRSGQATAFPAGVALAASWDTALIEEVGRALGRETRAKGRNVLLGPCVNIHRTPFGGRNFESYGEDPFLAARLAVAYIKGVQSQKVIATVKHFACNNQEYQRMTIDAQVDERTLQEIYLPAFRAAVQEAGVWAVMGAYNRLNGAYACASRPLLIEILKTSWGFPGLVMSDWGAVHGVGEFVNAGLDLEMPGGEFLTRPNLESALAAQQIDVPTIDDKVRRLLRVMLAMGLFDVEQDQGALDTPEHRALARRAAAEGIVLLRNEPLPAEQGLRPSLPLNKKMLRSIAVIGPNANVARTGGGGSSFVTPTYSVTPLEGLQAKFQNASVTFAAGLLPTTDLKPIPSVNLLPPAGIPGAAGLQAEYFDNSELKGDPRVTRVDPQLAFDWKQGGPGEGLGVDGFSVRWTGRLRPTESGRYALGLTSDDGSRLTLDGKVVLEHWGQHGATTRSRIVELKAGKTYDVKLEYFEASGDAKLVFGWQKIADDPLQLAVKAAERAEVAVIFAGLSDEHESEGGDRTSLRLPEDQEELIRAVAQKNRRTVVVLNSGAAVVMGDWARFVPTIVQAWYLGQETGNAIADVLAGDVNPAGKLPTTFLLAAEDAPSHANYPGQDGVVRYAEGIFVGYRHFDKLAKTVLFPFGHGLSYTGFAYRDLKVAPTTMGKGQTIEVSFALTNTGAVDGAEVAQLYIRDIQASLPRPVKELKGFQKTVLKKGETKEVRFVIDESQLSFYNPAAKAWVVEPGAFEVLIGSSVADIWLRRQFMFQ